jgi:hypothetical protein
MPGLRLVLFSAALVMMLPPRTAVAMETEAEYVGGTVKTIPANTTGALNLDDNKDLRFYFGKSTYRLAYDQITSAETLGGEEHHGLGKITGLFSRISRKKRETLSVIFQDAAGTSGALNFELTAEQATDARATIGQRTRLAANGEDPEQWWGDKYWKTTRNRGAWASERQPEPAAAPAGTK